MCAARLVIRFLQWQLLLFLISTAGWSFDLLGIASSWGWLAVASGALYAAWRFLLKPTYSDFGYEPINLDDLDDETRAYFDRHTAQFTALGCRVLGDFQLQPPPDAMHVRHFLTPDRHVFGDICGCVPSLSCSFSTVFEDGTLLETGNDTMAGKASPPLKDRLFFQALPGADIATLYQRHLTAVEEYAESLRVPAIRVTAERLFEFTQYGHRLVWWSIFREPRKAGRPVPPSRMALA
jgi:hypothetical protein